jgi:hypothetical protein
MRRSLRDRLDEKRSQAAAEFIKLDGSEVVAASRDVSRTSFKLLNLILQKFLKVHINIHLALQHDWIAVALNTAEQG